MRRDLFMYEEEGWSEEMFKKEIIPHLKKVSHNVGEFKAMKHILIEVLPPIDSFILVREILKAGIGTDCQSCHIEGWGDKLRQDDAIKKHYLQVVKTEEEAIKKVLKKEGDIK